MAVDQDLSLDALRVPRGLHLDRPVLWSNSPARWAAFSFGARTTLCDPLPMDRLRAVHACAVLVGVLVVYRSEIGRASCRERV